MGLCHKQQLGKALRRVQFYEDTMRQVLDHVYYVEHGPARDQIRMLLEAALATEEPYLPMFKRPSKRNKRKEGFTPSGKLVQIGRICDPPAEDRDLEKAA